MVRARLRLVGPQPAACGVTTSVTASELAVLIALSDAVDPVLLSPACELAAGHDGGHVAFVGAVHSGDQWWWVRWRGRSHEVVPLDSCNAERAVGTDFDCCMLPCDHPGPHSYDIRPDPH
jgi:hypothetical protein